MWGGGGMGDVGRTDLKAGEAGGLGEQERTAADVCEAGTQDPAPRAQPPVWLISQGISNQGEAAGPWGVLPTPLLRWQGKRRGHLKDSQQPGRKERRFSKNRAFPRRRGGCRP